MADRMKFFNDFRSAVSDLLDCYDRVKKLKDFKDTIGWNAADFTDLLAANPEGLIDMVLFDALDTRVPILTTAFDAVDDYLAKFRP